MTMEKTNREKAEEIVLRYMPTDDVREQEGAIAAIERLMDEKDKRFQAARDTAIKNHWHKHMGIDCVFGAAAEGCVDSEIERRLKDLEPKK